MDSFALRHGDCSVLLDGRARSAAHELRYRHERAKEKSMAAHCGHHRTGAAVARTKGGPPAGADGNRRRVLPSAGRPRPYTERLLTGARFFLTLYSGYRTLFHIRREVERKARVQAPVDSRCILQAGAPLVEEILARHLSYRGGWRLLNKVRLYERGKS